MTLNRVKPGRAVTFMKHLASVLSIFLPKTLKWHEISFLTSNPLHLAGLVVNELMKSISKKIIKIPFSNGFITA